MRILPIEVNNVKVTTSETFQFQLSRGFLNVTVCEEVGSLHIESDWGCASACWPLQAGKMKSFLATVSSDYVDRKLGARTLGGRGMQLRAPGWETAERNLKEKIISLRRTFDLTKGDARGSWDAVERWTYDRERSIDEAVAYAPQEVYALTGGEPWYFVEEEDTPTAIFWAEHVIPTVLSHFRSLVREATQRQEQTL